MPTYVYMGLKNKDKYRETILSQVTYKIDDQAKLHRMAPQRIERARAAEAEARLAEIEAQVKEHDSRLVLRGREFLKGEPTFIPPRDDFAMDPDDLSFYDKLEAMVKAKVLKPVEDGVTLVASGDKEAKSDKPKSKPGRKPAKKAEEPVKPAEEAPAE